ncbi:hypothetical protein BU23DRAFT_242262 [Bimuria novae-zelandiae CBS 107.79]|uniref:Transcription factor domain-containing protein n=1 Tax=Bimuria novae-zelandiae CBS 107.79 TaxID=1447943 RepID=A0A6A5UY24_9PLEO|nr:hypothetical protein BU23DRAFT_242262 [Bimuria novae-zelandiae CBS 107.79]
MLDTHSSMDRGTVTMLHSSAFRSPPLNINDCDIPLVYNMSVASSQGLTEMSHTAMTHAAMICQRRMHEYSLGADYSTWSHWPMMLNALSDFKGHVENDIRNLENATGPLATLHRVSGAKILISLQLVLRRPPYRQARNIVPPWDDVDILEAATDVLERHIQPVNAELTPWAWKNWVQWHALAVTLAELLVRSHGALSERAFLVASQSFTKYAALVADGGSGMFWRPIARLMRRVQRLRRSPPQAMPQLLPESINVGQAHLDNAVPDVPPGNLAFSDFDDQSAPTDEQYMFTNEENQSYDHLDSIYIGENTRWLAWDCFLQDLDFAGV